MITDTDDHLLPRTPRFRAVGSSYGDLISDTALKIEPTVSRKRSKSGDTDTGTGDGTSGRLKGPLFETVADTHSLIEDGGEDTAATGGLKTYAAGRLRTQAIHRQIVLNAYHQAAIQTTALAIANLPGNTIGDTNFVAAEQLPQKATDAPTGIVAAPTTRLGHRILTSRDSISRISATIQTTKYILAARAEAAAVKWGVSIDAGGEAAIEGKHSEGNHNYEARTKKLPEIFYTPRSIANPTDAKAAGNQAKPLKGPIDNNVAGTAGDAKRAASQKTTLAPVVTTVVPPTLTAPTAVATVADASMIAAERRRQAPASVLTANAPIDVKLLNKVEVKTSFIDRIPPVKDTAAGQRTTVAPVADKEAVTRVAPVAPVDNKAQARKEPVTVKAPEAVQTRAQAPASPKTATVIQLPSKAPEQTVKQPSVQESKPGSVPKNAGLPDNSARAGVVGRALPEQGTAQQKPIGPQNVKPVAPGDAKAPALRAVEAGGRRDAAKTPSARAADGDVLNSARIPSTRTEPGARPDAARTPTARAAEPGAKPDAKTPPAGVADAGAGRDTQVPPANDEPNVPNGEPKPKVAEPTPPESKKDGYRGEGKSFADRARERMEAQERDREAEAQRRQAPAEPAPRQRVAEADTRPRDGRPRGPAAPSVG